MLFSEVIEQEFSSWTEWDDIGVDFLLKNLSVKSHEALVKSCQKKEYDRTTHQRVDAMDQEKFLRKVSDLVIDWREFTAGAARKKVRIKKTTPDKEEFPFSPENRDYVMRNFPGFLSWVLDSSRELHLLIEEERETEEKN